MKTKIMIAVFVLVFALATVPLFARGGGAGSHGASGSMHGAAGTHGNAADNGGGKGSTGAKSASEQLSSKPKLSAKLQSLLPAGTNLQQAAQGFKNLGQFVATVHVSHNLGIPFDQLKSKMIGPPSMSLGKAIHALKPDANAKDESKKAGKQAKQDLKDSGTES